MSGFEDLDIEEVAVTVDRKKSAVGVQESLRRFKVDPSEIGSVGLSLIAESLERIAEEGGIQAIRKMTLQTVLDQPWPTAVKQLLTIRATTIRGGRSWSQLLHDLDIDENHVNCMIRVNDALLDLQLDPERFPYIEPEKIEPHLPQIRNLKNRAEMSCYIMNLPA